jgi:hypothetical protein
VRDELPDRVPRSLNGSDEDVRPGRARQPHARRSQPRRRGMGDRRTRGRVAPRSVRGAGSPAGQSPRSARPQLVDRPRRSDSRLICRPEKKAPCARPLAPGCASIDRPAGPP